jgi:hypothetical protein
VSPLINETDIVRTLRETLHTFDVHAESAGFLYNNDEVLIDAMRRGVKFRILLYDQGLQNRANAIAYQNESGATEREMNTDFDMAKLAAIKFRNIKTAFEKQRGASTGSLEVRWKKGLYFDSFWIRDGDISANALGHIEVRYYKEALSDPIIRFGSLSPLMIRSLQHEFDLIWADGEPTEPSF